MKFRDNIYFVVGHRGVGKTFLLNRLSENLELIHIDTGPLMREAHIKDTNNETDIENWVKCGEDQFGANFTNYILCKEIDEKISETDDCPIFITGNRSLKGIEYIANHLEIADQIKIIYLDGSFDL